jgi:hypothetical protein
VAVDSSVNINRRPVDYVWAGLKNS